MTDSNLQYDYASRQRVLQEQHYGDRRQDFPVEDRMDNPYIMTPATYLDEDNPLTGDDVGDTPAIPANADGSYPFLWYTADGEGSEPWFDYDDQEVIVIRFGSGDDGVLFPHPTFRRMPTILYPGAAIKVIYYEAANTVFEMYFWNGIGYDGDTCGFIRTTQEAADGTLERTMAIGTDASTYEIYEEEDSLTDIGSGMRCQKVWFDPDAMEVKVKWWAHNVESEPAAWNLSGDVNAFEFPYRWALVASGGIPIDLGQVKVWRHYEGVDTDADFTWVDGG